MFSFLSQWQLEYFVTQYNWPLRLRIYAYLNIFLHISACRKNNIKFAIKKMVSLPYFCCVNPTVYFENNEDRNAMDFNA